MEISRFHTKMQPIYLIFVIFFVSLTLAQEKDRRTNDSTEKSNLSNNASLSEENLRAAGMLPSWEEIRESFRKFQAHLNNIRRYGGFNSQQDNSSNIISNKNITNNNRTNSYARSGVNFYGSGFFPDENNPGSSRFHPINIPADSEYPPGFIRRSNPYFPTASTPTLSTSELQRHTTTTIYIICICLVIMAVGCILFMCVNKCQARSGIGNGNPVGATRSSAINNRSNRNSRVSVSTVSLAISSLGNSSGTSSNTSGSTLNIPGANIEYDAKITYDLPPSYASLFPQGNKPS